MSIRLFQKKANLPQSFGFLKTDLHSHILPGIDDGAKDVEESLELVRGLNALGYDRFIATPHILMELHPNSPETILPALEKLRSAVREAGLDVRIDAAAEYMMDDGFEPVLEAGNLLTLPGNRVLVEMGFINPPPRLHDYLFRLQTKGYKPLLAHPERYLFLKDRFAEYQRLREIGCEFQLNLLSLYGYYGKPVRDTAQKLLKNNMIDFLGTDLHHARHLENLQNLLTDSAAMSLLQRYTFKNAQL
ncbi:MAG TPA: hypothetical protein PKE06_05120 [Flavilitoribacter sp.]|nr:hypothetical protein [Flavilitoribacter sp.]